jgi:hypothetical protein
MFHSCRNFSYNYKENLEPVLTLPTGCKGGLLFTDSNIIVKQINVWKVNIGFDTIFTLTPLLCCKRTDRDYMTMKSIFGPVILSYVALGFYKRNTGNNY